MRVCFGHMLKKIREARGFSQRALAKETRLTQEAISNYEMLSRKPSYKNQKEILKALDLENEVRGIDKLQNIDYLMKQIQCDMRELRIQIDDLKKENELLLYENIVLKNNNEAYEKTR